MTKYRRSNKEVQESKVGWFCLAILTMVACLGGYGTAVAFEIPTGNNDAKLRWDNTLRYTYGHRVQDRNQQIMANPNLDDGDRNFGVGTVMNRVDLLSESDLIYKKEYGVRVSGAFWYDQRYRSGWDDKSGATSNHLVNGIQAPGISNYADRYFSGPSGELLDAFAFGKVKLGWIPVNIKAGRHTVIWGESMLGISGAHSISYAQSSMDFGKALMQPGVELKELFRPRAQISMQAQPADTLSIAAQYFLQWEANRFPEPGTYLGTADFLGNGGESLLAGPPFHPYAVNGGDIEPHQAKDYGVSVRWSPEFLVDGTIGFYYRRLTDTGGQLHLQLGAVPVPGAPPGTLAHGVPVSYRWAFPSGIDLYGISFAKQFSGISLGSELSYRRNMPLWSNAATIGPYPGLTSSSFPGMGETLGARGDTWHGVVNLMYVVPKNVLFDTAMIITEFAWSRLDHVTQNPELFKSGGAYASNDAATKDYIGGQLNFQPTWYQVLPGMDLSMLLTGNIGLSGNAAVAGGGTKNAGSYSAGITADLYQKYTANLSYVGFFGPLAADATGALQAGNTSNIALKDRGTVLLTLKTYF
ncbi:MAG: DUF1302 domain-containing protein [Desulfuromonadaceae bacterium]|nr:DUF1302 domain-containing protein [Desulfuromonadaceae bacterium]